jgi:hypothetical protein
MANNIPDIASRCNEEVFADRPAMGIQGCLLYVHYIIQSD